MPSLDVLSPAQTEFEPTLQLLELPIALRNGESASVRSLLDEFYGSMFGEYMRTKQPLRFPREAYDRELSLADSGTDLCPIGHQMHTVRHLSILIEQERADGTLLALDDRSTAVLLLAGGLHDMGECQHPELLWYTDYLPGDKPSGTKEPEDVEAEAAVRRLFYNTIFRHVDPSVIEEIEALISHANKDTSLLHDYLHAARSAQTLRTAMNAQKAYANAERQPRTEVDETRLLALKAMSTEVFANSQKEVEKAVSFPHLMMLLEASKRPPARL